MPEIHLFLVKLSINYTRLDDRVIFKRRVVSYLIAYLSNVGCCQKCVLSREGHVFCYEVFFQTIFMAQY